ncbi:MAG: cation:proton antiporter, partial [Vulcanisaeta sp.]
VMGLRLDAAYLVKPNILINALIVSALAIIGKVIGIYPFAYAKLRSGREALIASYGMIPRGEMGLVVASLGLASGFISEGDYGVIILMVLITTIVGATTYRRAACRLRSRYRGASRNP